MLNRVVLVCQGETAAPHRAEFIFDRSLSGRWESLHLEALGEHDTDPRNQVNALLYAGADWDCLEGHHFVTDVDGERRYRVRGGVRRTKRGVELECWRRHSDARRGVYSLPFSILTPALDALALQGIPEFDVAELLRRAAR
ncbi:hypothetical protein [Lentzea nigeriaca]|uniref:hypothetical protein n=1 Tax=Lentzea nigeriaca TaxID=1128665 RepID=UPI001959ED4E|nr:hypothetical protein [Lentzea nigeriaca]MBM7861784.1 hypothetical protein [Lentzea nigeriaca]